MIKARHGSCQCQGMTSAHAVDAPMSQHCARAARRAIHTVVTAPRARRHELQVLLLCLLPTLAACVANPVWPKQPKPNVFDREPRLYALADLGLGAPVGYAGAGMGFAPTQHFALELSGGASTGGPQMAAMLSMHARWLQTWTVGLASGISAGPALEHEPDFDDKFDELPPTFDKRYSWVAWSNTELQLRQALSNYVALRYHFGVALQLAKTRGVCSAEGSENASACLHYGLAGALPYVGLGFEVTP